MTGLKDKLAQLHQRLAATVLGSEEAAYLLIISLISNGHVLIQGAPGIGKTSLAQALADAISCRFRRIQFTPDLLPSDILGYSMYHQGRGEFDFIEGAVFSNIVLADEINRTSPRIQSALLECMNEQQVSIDGVTRKLESPFLVIATQNDVYSSGTFPLPEPQLDRFLLSINMQIPTREIQAEILRKHADGVPEAMGSAGPILSGEEILQVQQAVSGIAVNDRLCRYVVDLCEAGRSHRELDARGLSARASIALMRAAQAAAFLEGQDTVYPDDVKRVAQSVLQHRVTARDPSEGGGSQTGRQIAVLLRETPVP